MFNLSNIAGARIALLIPPHQGAGPVYHPENSQPSNSCGNGRQNSNDYGYSVDPVMYRGGSGSGSDCGPYGGYDEQNRSHGFQSRDSCERGGYNPDGHGQGGYDNRGSGRHHGSSGYSQGYGDGYQRGYHNAQNSEHGSSHHYVGSSHSNSNCGSANGTRNFTTNQTDGGNGTVKTADGYTVKFVGADQATGGSISVTDPQGNTSEIYGDPHEVSADGSTAEYKKDASFTFGNNTLHTTTSASPNSGYTNLDSATLTSKSGGDGVAVSGLSDGTNNLTFSTGNSRIMDSQSDDVTHQTIQNGNFVRKNGQGGYTPVTTAWIAGLEAADAG